MRDKDYFVHLERLHHYMKPLSATGARVSFADSECITSADGSSSPASVLCIVDCSSISPELSDAVCTFFCFFPLLSQDLFNLLSNCPCPAEECQLLIVTLQVQ